MGYRYHSNQFKPVGFARVRSVACCRARFDKILSIHSKGGTVDKTENIEKVFFAPCLQLVILLKTQATEETGGFEAGLGPWQTARASLLVP